MIDHGTEASIPGSQDVSPRQVVPAGTSPTVSRILRETQPWARFMGIVGFVSVGLMMLIGLGAGATGIATGNAETIVFLVVYPLMALLYVFPSLYLVRYANRIRDYVTHGQQSHLEAALDAQRSFWKFVGILTLVGLVVAVLIVLATVVIAVLFVQAGQ